MNAKQLETRIEKGVDAKSSEIIEILVSRVCES